MEVRIYTHTIVLIALPALLDSTKLYKNIHKMKQSVQTVIASAGAKKDELSASFVEAAKGVVAKVCECVTWQANYLTLHHSLTLSIRVGRMLRAMQSSA